MTSQVDEQTIAKWQAIVDRLAYATQMASISWKKALNDDAFITTVGRNIIYFELARGDNYGEDVYFFRIKNSAGDTVDQFYEANISVNGANYYNMLRDLHIQIGRALTGADKVLDEILAALPEIPKRPSRSADLDDDIPF